MSYSILKSVACAAMLCLSVVVYATPPILPDGSADAEKRIATFKVPQGIRIQLFAAEPHLASPVAIGLDERNRVFVAEEYRFNLGTEENRTRPFLLEDDLQLQTLDDRLKLYEKFADRFEGGMEWFRKVADQVRLVEDTDGDGRADRSTIFAPDFNGTLDGLAAGVMAKDGDVYFTCIPNLWRLRDTDDDGIADERVVIQTGFGVNAGFLGHDLHGLCWGPDGKLYFSIGDRGFHLLTQEGSILHGPRNGAVFRCEPDGSQLEVVCRGLRNPQELAFDQWGNLFAADNNCDKGDHSRLVYCLEGSDSGWNMSFQSIPDPYLTGPWHAEKMWHLWPVTTTNSSGLLDATSKTSIDAERPGWVLPPVGKLGAGPSGFTYYPGTGFSPRYDQHFLMCNFTGNGGIEAFRLAARGAGFEIAEEHDLMKPILASDCEFGYDGKLYVADFVNLIWNGGSSGGRIYTLTDPQHVEDPAVKSCQELVRTPFKKYDNAKLAGLLEHADLRVRQRAQFALAERVDGGLESLRSVLTTSPNRLARLHALWGLGQMARSGDVKNQRAADAVAATDLIKATLVDPDDEIRAWSVQLMGDLRFQPAAALVVQCLKDSSPRVRLFAAIATGKLDHARIPEELISLIRENNDADPWLKHGTVIGLCGIASRQPASVLNPILTDPSPAVRHAGLLAIRHLYQQCHEWSYHRETDMPVSTSSDEHCQHAMRTFLRDPDLRIVTDAARAINDLPLKSEYQSLADQVDLLNSSQAVQVPEALVRRIINANFRLGDLESASRVFSIVINPAVTVTMRREAASALIDWKSPSPRDRVTGFWNPVPARSTDVILELQTFLAAKLPTLLEQADAESHSDAIRLISEYQLPIDDALLATWVQDSDRGAVTRSSALGLLVRRNSSLALPTIEKALSSDVPLLRADSRDFFAVLDPQNATPMLAATLTDEAATITEKQRALMTLANLKLETSDRLLQDWMDRLNRDQIPDPLHLDLLEAAAQRNTAGLKESADRFRAKLASGGLMAQNRPSLYGGDADRGRKTFLGHPVGQCLRCHKVGTQIAGGNAGPDLNQVATRHNRESLLQSLLEPNAKIAKGFESTTIILNDGRVFGGIIRQEDRDTIVLEKAEGGTVSLKVDEVDERSAPKSAMPEMTRALTPRELRDLVEFLSQLK